MNRSPFRSFGNIFRLLAGSLSEALTSLSADIITASTTIKQVINLKNEILRGVFRDEKDLQDRS